MTVVQDMFLHAKRHIQFPFSSDKRKTPNHKDNPIRTAADCSIKMLIPDGPV